MHARERFLKTFRFEKTDRPFRWEFPGIWPSALENWRRDGLPDGIVPEEYFELDKLEFLPLVGAWTLDPFVPMFERQVLEDDGVHQVIIDTDGIKKKIMKQETYASMPSFLEFPVKTREDYREKILWRLDPEDDGRFPADWAQRVAAWQTREHPLGMFVIGPFGHLRNLMGDEELMYLLYDDPDFVHGMLAHWCDFYIRLLQKVCADVTPDFIMIWEDNCYKNGPLISPAFFETYMSPLLARVIDAAKALGIPGIIVDTDGDCSSMLPVYLACGANGFYPFEVQSGMDIVQVRQQYGDRFVIIGGLDKRTLAQDAAAVQRELAYKMPPLVASGGFIPMLDHSVPTDAKYDLFRLFLETVRSYR